MEMLVAVQMRDGQACCEHALDLRAQLALDVNAAPQQQELHVTPWHRRAGRQRHLFDEGEMDADFERRHVAQPRNGVIEGGSVRHDAARRDDPVAVGADRPRGHAAIEADVVGSDDEAA